MQFYYQLSLNWNQKDRKAFERVSENAKLKGMALIAMGMPSSQWNS